MRRSLNVRAICTAVGVALCMVELAHAAEESKLSRKPIPLQTEAYALFAVEDIVSYEDLLEKLKAGAGDPTTPAGRIWSYMSPALREQLAAIEPGTELEHDTTYDMINGLNAVVRFRDLYDSEVWAGVELPEELKAELEAGLDSLGPVEATARNRQLIRHTFPDEILTSQVRPFPERPRTLHIFGDEFLNHGDIQKGFTIPTGAVWQPSLFVYGTLRTAWQYEETGNDLPPITDVAGPPIRRGEAKIEELATRLDLFFNLALTPTERIVLAFRPLDHGGNHDGYRWQSPNLDSSDEWILRADMDVEQLYFEGDFGEIFPGIDPNDTGATDVGFSVGRQPLFFQEGIIINDNIDALGLTRNNVQVGKAANIRVTGVWAWDELDRGVGINSRLRKSAHMFGLFTSTDFANTTMDFDLAYINDHVSRVRLEDGTTRLEGGDQFNAGLSFVQRIGHFSTAFRLNHSEASGENTIHSSSGSVFLFESNVTLPYSHDLIYANMFLANDHYQSVAREPSVGGPLARLGVLFDTPGIGFVGAPIENDTDHDSFGGALGFQKFFDASRKHLLIEVGGRDSFDGENDRGRLGILARYQQAFSTHYVWRVDAYHVERESLDSKQGIRTEFVVQF